MSTATTQSPRSTQPTAADILRFADTAAQAVAGEIEADPHLALRRGWSCLDSWRDAVDSARPPTDLAQLIRHELTAHLPAAAAQHAICVMPAVLAAPQPSREPAPDWDVAGILLHVQVLRAAALEPQHRRAARFGIGFVAAMLVALLVALAVGLVRGPTGPWRGHFFDNRDFEGEARVRHARKLEFDWGRDAPMRGIGHDSYSAIWETCLELEEETRVNFRLTSDDGSRLHIGDELVIENWGARPTRTRSGSIVLRPGVHPMRVEYFEASHGANLELLAAFGGGTPASIPVDMLIQPEDGDEPCPTAG